MLRSTRPPHPERAYHSRAPPARLPASCSSPPPHSCIGIPPYQVPFQRDPRRPVQLPYLSIGGLTPKIVITRTKITQCYLIRRSSYACLGNNCGHVEMRRDIKGGIRCLYTSGSNRYAAHVCYFIGITLLYRNLLSR